MYEGYDDKKEIDDFLFLPILIVYNKKGITVQRSNNEPLEPFYFI